MITGSERSDRLTGGKNLTMKGNGGADTYFVENSAYGDIVEIDNDDTADIPAQDTLILPWKLSETLMSIAEPWEVSNTFQSIVQSNPLLTDALARWNVLTTASAA